MAFERVSTRSKSRAALFTLCFMLFCLHSKRLFAYDKIYRLTAENGTLMSEEKLGHFMGHTSFIWEIEVKLGYRIELIVHVFEVKTSCCSCREDYVEFHDGLLAASPLIGRYCANNKPIRVYSSKNALRVKYFSSAKDPQINLTSVNKFRAEYKTICGKFVQGKSGEISFPGHPNFTDRANQHCLFTIVVPYGWIKLTFMNFTVGMLHKYSDVCDTDFVMVKEMAFVELKHTILRPQRFCGKLKSRYIFSRGQELSLFYHASFKSSFAAKFQATNKSLALCGGLRTKKAGYIYSYGYPNSYPSNTECIWKIEVPHGYIKLEYLAFNLTTDSRARCTGGKVEVYDGWSVNALKIRTDCGQLIKRTWVKSQSRRLLIKATSEASKIGTFLLSYNLVEQGLCPEHEFCCTNRECVSQDDVCDGEDDCSDGSDELNCPTGKTKALYILWALLVVLACTILFIWLWRMWRKAFQHSHRVRRDRPCPEEDDYSHEVPSQSGAPPTYSEALNHTPTNLPSYEQVLLDGNEGVIVERGNAVRFLTRSDSCDRHLLATNNSQRAHGRPNCTRQSLGIV